MLLNPLTFHVTFAILSSNPDNFSVLNVEFNVVFSDALAQSYLPAIFHAILPIDVFFTTLTSCCPVNPWLLSPNTPMILYRLSSGQVASSEPKQI